jgi:hypothetical protein
MCFQVQNDVRHRYRRGIAVRCALFCKQAKLISRPDQIVYDQMLGCGGRPPDDDDEPAVVNLVFSGKREAARLAKTLLLRILTNHSRKDAVLFQTQASHSKS